MVLVQILEMVGVGGGLLILAVAALLLYETQTATTMASRAVTWVQAALVFTAILAVGLTGVVPGFHLEFDPMAVWDWVAQILP